MGTEAEEWYKSFLGISDSEASTSETTGTVEDLLAAMGEWEKDTTSSGGRGATTNTGATEGELLSALTSLLGGQLSSATSLFGQQAGMTTEQQLADALSTMAGIKQTGEYQQWADAINQLLGKPVIDQTTASQIIGAMQDQAKATAAGEQRGMAEAAARSGNVGAAMQAGQVAASELASTLANATRDTLANIEQINWQGLAEASSQAGQLAQYGGDVAAQTAALQTTPTQDKDVYQQMYDTLFGEGKTTQILASGAKPSSASTLSDFYYPSSKRGSTTYGTTGGGLLGSISSLLSQYS